MNMRRGVRLAAVVFLCTWIPLSLWRGLAMGRSFRIGHRDSGAWGPLADAVINIGAIMLAPALLVALVAFVFWAWREERRAESKDRAARR